MFEALDEHVKSVAAPFSGDLAVALHDFRTGEAYAYNAATPMRAASLIKVPLLVHALHKVARAELRLEQRLMLQAEAQVGGSGVLHRFQAGIEPSLHDLLTLMIIVSDNTATNLIIELLGLEAANTFITNIGMRQTRLVGKLQVPEAEQNAAQRRGERNTTTAADMLLLLLGLERGDLLPPAQSETALTILKQQQFTEALARYLPTDAELNSRPVTVASKSGCLRGLWHDAALVCDQHAQPLYALIIMTENAQDQSYSWEQEGMMLIAKLSAYIYRHLIAQA